MKTTFKKFARIAGYISLVIFLLVVIIALLLQLPSVQTLIAKKITASIAQKTGGHISIAKVAIRLPDAVRLKDVYVEDLQQDTLLYTAILKVDINLFALLKHKVIIDNVYLKNAVVNLNEDRQDSSFNFQYLINAFSRDTTQPKSIVSNPWTFSINTVELENVRADVNAPVSGFSITGFISEFSLNADKLDIESREIDFDEVLLKNSVVAIALSPRDTAVKEIDTLKTARTYLIPSIGWTFKASKIDFADNEVAIDDNGKEPLPQGMDFSHLYFSNLSIKIKDALYAAHTIKADIQNISTEEKSGLMLKRFKGNVSIDTAGITVNGLKANSNHSHLESSIRLRFKDLNSLKNLSQEVILDADFEKSLISMHEILLLVPQMAENENFNLKAVDSIYVDGNISGATVDLNGKDFIFSLNHSTYAHVDFHVKGLPDTDKAYFNLKISEFTATPSVVSSIINKELPEELTRLGKMNLKGEYHGTIRDMNFDGAVSTSLGDVNVNLKAQFNQNYSHAWYEGILKLENFQLGALLADTSIGALTLEASVKGKGLAVDSLQAELTATIKEAVYRNYNYKDIAIDGTLYKKKFAGKLNINDENLRFDFTGLVDLNDSLPAFKFEASLDTVNLGALHLMTNNVGIHADLWVNFQGLDIDKFNGRATLKNIHVASDSLSYSMDSVTATATTESSQSKILEITSPVLNAKLTGNFNAADLPKLLINYVNDYFPVYLGVDSTDKPPRLAIEPNRPSIPDQKFTLLVTVSKPLKLVKMFVPKVTSFDTAYVIGSFDSKEKSLQLNATMPGLVYDSIKVDTVDMNVEGDRNDLQIITRIENLNYQGKTSVLNAGISLTMANDNMDVSLNIDGDSIRRLGLGATVTRQLDAALRVRLHDSLTFNGAKWSIPDNNYIDMQKGYLFFDNVQLQHNGQQLSVSSLRDSVNAPINIGFTNFQLHELSDFADYNKIKADGIINGKLILKNVYTHPSFTADIDITNIAINENAVGNMTLNAVQHENDIDVNIKLSGGENNLLASGKFFPSSATMEIDIDMQHLNLNVADPFLSNFISESQGFLSAKLKADGKFSEPNLSGKISFHQLSTKVPFANARFDIADNSITIDNDRIAVNRLQILDEQKRTAVINGTMVHKNFSDIQLDLTLNTSEFMFINTTEKHSGLFYGKVVLAINGHVTGSPTLPYIDARASTKPGMQVFIVPLGQAEDVIKHEDFVLFQSPPFEESINPDSIAQRQQYVVNVTGVGLNLAFELTPDAELQIIIDPLASDKLICKGSADLLIDIPAAGTPQVSGAYIVESGSYSYKPPLLPRKEFTIKKGGRIDFSGDIMNARLDLTATNTIYATTYDLIATQSASLSASEATEAKRRSPVNVVLLLKGQLSQPELTFDIQLSPENSNLVSSAVARRLSQIREEPSELNKQVFALLAFNSFIATESTGPDLESAGENVVLRSVSNLISSQLNRLANRVEGFEINLDLRSYKSKYETEQGNDMLTEVGIDVSKQFFNQRLELTVGGNVNVENATTSGQGKGGFTAITGDFTLEYKLTDNGKYRVKVFQNTDYDVLNQANEYRTGIGFTYRESFRKLLKKRKSAEKKNGTQSHAD